MRNLFHRNNSCTRDSLEKQQEQQRQQDETQAKKGPKAKNAKDKDQKTEDEQRGRQPGSSLASSMVPEFIKRRFTRPSQRLPPEVPESEIKVGSTSAAQGADEQRAWSRYSIRRVRNSDDCVPAETKLFGRFYPSFRLPGMMRPRRASMPDYDVKGLWERIIAALRNLLSNLRELFTIPPHVIQSLLQFIRALPLLLAILMLICVMNILPVVLIASYKNSVGCGVLSGLFCIGDMSEKGLLEYLNVEAFVMLSCWYCLQLVLAGAPVGALARYENNETGEHVCIRHNAVFALYVSLSLIFLVFLFPSASPLLSVHEYLMGLCVASLVFTFALSLLLHTNSFKTEHLSGDAIEGLEIFNFFVGKATHPLITGIDMKRFLCLRPGLIGLVFCDWLLLLHHLQSSGSSQEGAAQQFNCAFVVLAIFHFCYVLQAMNLEIDFLATFRYSRDGFGYMHAWYSLVFIPFFYGLQSYYLFDLSNSPSTEASLGGWGMLSSSVPGVVLGSVLFFSGHYLLDVSTKQKTIFRRMRSHPKVYYLDQCRLATNTNNSNNTNDNSSTNNRGDSVSRQRGSTASNASGGAHPVSGSFICSGFWGLVRHPNLLGELLMCLSFSVVTGIGNIAVHLPLMIQLCVVIGRSVRKEYAFCREYGNCYKYYSSKTPPFIPNLQQNINTTRTSRANKSGTQ